ncbi:hypothetical protein BH18ACT17_BH18ACT17_12290 [soil metagenome]
MTWVALALAGATLVIGLSIAPRLRAFPSVRQQLMALAVLAIVLTLAPLVVFGVITFRSGLLTSQGIAVLAVGIASTGAALAAASSLQRAIMRALDGLSASAAELAAGDLSVRAPTQGPQEVRDLAAAFDRMAENVERHVESRRELTAWISHDLGAPVTLMRAMLEAIEDGVVEPERYLGPLREQVEALADLISDLLELSRIDGGQLTVHPHQVPLGDTIEAATAAVAALASKERVRIDTSIEPGLPSAWCDRDLVDRVLLNLITNAVRHTPAGGQVRVRAWASGSEVLVAVDNSGLSIGDDAIVKIFEPYWRGDAPASSSKEQRRLGLGLTIARALIAAQGGRIWAENRREGGVSLIFSLEARR